MEYHVCINAKWAFEPFHFVNMKLRAIVFYTQSSLAYAHTRVFIVCVRGRTCEMGSFFSFFWGCWSLHLSIALFYVVLSTHVCVCVHKYRDSNFNEIYTNLKIVWHCIGPEKCVKRVNSMDVNRGHRIAYGCAIGINTALTQSDCFYFHFNHAYPRLEQYICTKPTK